MKQTLMPTKAKDVFLEIPPCQDLSCILTYDKEIVPWFWKVSVFGQMMFWQSPKLDCAQEKLTFSFLQ